MLAGALARLGAVQVPLLPILREREIGLHPAPERSSAPRRARRVAGRGLPGTCHVGDRRDRERRPRVVGVTIVDRTLPEADSDALPPWGAIRPAREADPLRWIFFTSGTTAHPKGCLHTDRTVAAAAAPAEPPLRDAPRTTATRWCSRSPTSAGSAGSWAGCMAGYRADPRRGVRPADRRARCCAATASPSRDPVPRSGWPTSPSNDASPSGGCSRTCERSWAVAPPSRRRSTTRYARCSASRSSPATGRPSARASRTAALRHRSDARRADGHPLDDSAIRIAGRRRATVPARRSRARSSAPARCCSRATSTPPRTTARSTPTAGSAPATSACSTSDGCCG